MYYSSTISKRDAIVKVVSRLNKLLLDNLSTNRERAILPSSQSKIKKKILSSLTNKHSVILPSMLFGIKQVDKGQIPTEKR